MLERDERTVVVLSLEHRLGYRNQLELAGIAQHVAQAHRRAELFRETDQAVVVEHQEPAALGSSLLRDQHS